MKKIGIITIPDYDNYGNRLQNYAVKEFFSQMGYEVDTLELNDIDFEQYQSRKLKLFIKKFKFCPLVYLFEFFNGRKYKVERYKKFEAFTEKYLNVKYYPNGRLEKLKKVAAQYDYIVLGSDQIWHPNIMTTPNLFFATFVEPEKVLFFAPSFGVDHLSNAYSEKVRNGLENKSNITVREVSGKQIIYELTGKEALVLSDPTLCVSADSWKKVSVPMKYYENKSYILKYFLGTESESYVEEFLRIKSRYDLDIVEIGRKTSKGSYQTGPQEFLGAILNAEYVITDSFHAVAFCIIFNKPFTVFSRLNENGEKEGLDSRIDDLLAKFDIENRKFSYIIENDIGAIDCSNFNNILTSIHSTTVSYFSNIMKK